MAYPRGAARAHAGGAHVARVGPEWPLRCTAHASIAPCGCAPSLPACAGRCSDHRGTCSGRWAWQRPCMVRPSASLLRSEAHCRGCRGCCHFSASHAQAGALHVVYRSFRGIPPPILLRFRPLSRTRTGRKFPALAAAPLRAPPPPARSSTAHVYRRLSSWQRPSPSVARRRSSAKPPIPTRRPLRLLRLLRQKGGDH